MRIKGEGNCEKGVSEYRRASPGLLLLFLSFSLFMFLLVNRM